MIVCHRRQFIFVHLHKTGGTSVKEAFQPHLSEGDVIISAGRQTQAGTDQPSDLSNQLSKHSNARRIAEVLGSEIWDAYFKFSFVRHPLDRLVSLYEFFRRVRQNNSKKPGFLHRYLKLGRQTSAGDPSHAPWSWPGMQALVTTNSFSQFIRSEFLSKDQGAQPQARSLTDRSGKLMVDFVGKFERMSEDWQKVCDRVGINSKLPHRNQSDRRFENVKRYWNQDDLEFATKKYREDLLLFGYHPDEIV